MTDPTLEGLVAAVLQSPGDARLRFVLADWLEGHGRGWDARGLRGEGYWFIGSNDYLGWFGLGHATHVAPAPPVPACARQRPWGGECLCPFLIATGADGWRCLWCDAPRPDVFVNLTAVAP